LCLLHSLTSGKNASKVPRQDSAALNVHRETLGTRHLLHLITRMAINNLDQLLEEKGDLRRDHQLTINQL
jgi:hypothetical protein